MRVHPRLVLTLLTALLLTLALPVLAQEEAPEDEGDGATTTTVAESDYTPAVTVAESAPPEETPPWTTRYLIPTTLVLAGLAVFVTVVQYFLRVVRNRYKVVE